ncbi:MAG: hypothetical protein H6737_02780 [Alphaproteobacteria bacterium]|nr:hypothetical protein [Alphaproteobacteria bacterium]
MSESLRRHIDVDDGIETHLELLDILPPEQMQELVSDQLAGLGYTSEDDKTWTKKLDNGIEITVDLEDGSVHIGLSAEEDLSIELKRTTTTAEETRQTTENRLRQQTRADLEREADAATEALRVEVTRRLEESLETIRKELDGAVNRATGEALKIKAGQLGEVQEISEDPETGAVTIRVKV